MLSLKSIGALNWRSILITALALTNLSTAQATDATSITLTFYDATATPDLTCNATSPPEGITLKIGRATGDWGPCFPLNELFTTWASENRTSITSNSTSFYTVNYTLSSTSSFSPSTNYSGVFYSQDDGISSTAAGEDAKRYVRLFDNDACNSISGCYTGFKCLDEGSCRSMPFKIGSIALTPYVRVKGDEKCVVDAVNGDDVGSMAGESARVGGMMLMLSFVAAGMLMI